MQSATTGTSGPQPGYDDRATRCGTSDHGTTADRRAAAVVQGHVQPRKRLAGRHHAD